MKIKKINKNFLLILFLWLFSNCTNNPGKNENSSQNRGNNQDIPFENIQIEKTKFIINTQKDTIIISKSGSELVIPKNAFVDKDGIIIKEKVELHYREFSNAMDVYIAGIPMNYDSAATEQVFETAGMLEINAFSGNNEVFPNPQNKMLVKMTSFDQNKEMNLYQLDTVTKKWTYIGKDKIEVQKKEEMLKNLPAVPQPPKKATQNSFSVEDGTGDFPELKMYENVLFEPVDNAGCGSYSSTEIKVNDLGNGIFEVIFITDAFGMHREQKCKCYLAFKAGADYDKAMQVYQNKYKNRIENREKQKKEIEQQWETYNAVKKQYEDMGMLDYFYKTQVTGMKGEEKITRTLEINKFGFINCDLPTVYPQGAELIAQFTNEKGSNISIKNVVLIEKGRNALFRYKDKIKFNPQKENTLWGITDDGKLAYMKPEDFKNIAQTSGNYNFKMKVHNTIPKTYEEICKILF